MIYAPLIQAQNYWIDERGYECYWINGGERSTSWVTYPNLDLRPYLVEGWNTIRIDTSVSGRGEGWAFFEVSGYSEGCDFEFNNSCAEFEAASQ